MLLGAAPQAISGDALWLVLSGQVPLDDLEELPLAWTSKGCDLRSMLPLVIATGVGLLC